jgi:L-alanine-DL-glutamate epimerase-like enolase superfamily enzyme
MMANLHYALSTPGCLMVEMPFTPFPLREEFLVEQLDLRNGQIRVPDVPGLGVWLPVGAEQKYALQTGPTWVAG